MLFISDKTWRRICGHFNEQERTALRRRIRNIVLHPAPGMDVDVDCLEPRLRAKVFGLILDGVPAIARGESA